MSVTPEQAALVKSTFAQVEPIADKAAAIFYDRLFTVAPEVKQLFTTDDMVAQGQKLMKMIGAAVNGLDDLEALVPVVQDLGVRHVDYGVMPEHYDVVGASLLWTLEQGLGEAFTPDVKDAWAAVYTTLATVMKDAAYN